MYCEGETSTNLSTGASRTDLGIQASIGRYKIIQCCYLRMPSYQKVVVLDSEDTDWCTQTADVSHQLEGNLLIKSKNEFISCSAVLSEDVANMIIPLRLITGSDHTSGFYIPAKRNCCKND